MKVKIFKQKIIGKSKEEKEFLKEIKIKFSLSSIRYEQGNQIIDNEFPKISRKNISIYMGNNDNSYAFLFNHIDTSHDKIYIILNYNDVESVYFVDGETIKKKKSAIKRGIAGAVVAGPVGAVVGGLSGIGEKEEIDGQYMIIKTNEEKLIFKDSVSFRRYEEDLKKFFKEKLITKEDFEQEFLNSL